MGSLYDYLQLADRLEGLTPEDFALIAVFYGGHNNRNLYQP